MEQKKTNNRNMNSVYSKPKGETFAKILLNELSKEILSDHLKNTISTIKPKELIRTIKDKIVIFSDNDLAVLYKILEKQKIDYIFEIIQFSRILCYGNKHLGISLLNKYLVEVFQEENASQSLIRKAFISFQDNFILNTKKWVFGKDISLIDNSNLILFIGNSIAKLSTRNILPRDNNDSTLDSLNQKIFDACKWVFIEFGNIPDCAEEKRDLGRRMLASLPNDFPDEWKQELDQLYTELISKSFQAKEEPLSPANLPHIGAEEIKPPEEAPQAESVGEDAIQQSPSQPEIERVPEPLPEMKPAEALLREELQPAEPASEKETPIPPPESEVTPDSPEILNTEKVDGRTLLTEVLNWKDGQIKTLTLHRDQIIQQLGKLVELKGILEKTLATVIDTRGKGSPICLAIDHEFKSLNREMAQFEEQKRGLESQLAEAENEYLQLCQIESVLMVEFQKSDQILEAQKRELQLLTGQCQSLEHKLETTGQTLDQTSRELEEVVQQNWQLQADLNQARSEAVTAKTTLKRELEAFQLHLDEVLEKHLSEKLGAVHRSLVPHFQNFRTISKSIPSADMAECLVEWVQDLKKILKEKGIGIWE